MSALTGSLVTFWDWFWGTDGADIIKPAIVSVIVALLTFYGARWNEEFWSRRKWTRRDSLHRINFSLNRFTTAGELKLRSVCELPLADVVHNSSARRKLLAWAKAVKSPGDDPILAVCGEVRSGDETQSRLQRFQAAYASAELKLLRLELTNAEVTFINNCALNAIAPFFSHGTFGTDIGREVVRESYVFCVTCELLDREHEATHKQRKIRVMFVKKALMQQFPFPQTNPDTLPLLEDPLHKDRVLTLRRAATRYQLEPQQFGEMEICL